MLACAFMTVLVPKVAGVETVIACSPPRAGELHAPTLHSIATSGADRIFALGGVQALAAMAFGLLDGVAIEGATDIAPTGPVDMIVGPGNAFVAEAKRQLFGRVGIDLLAGPSEEARTYCCRLIRPLLTASVRNRRTLVSTPGNPETACQISALIFSWSVGGA